MSHHEARSGDLSSDDVSSHRRCGITVDMDTYPVEDAPTDPGKTGGLDWGFYGVDHW